ncbi:MAG: hypothetical protein CVU56_06480 [Deltaproteobacteria bacterium HGW-Deltaproteobacteria-14]|jgi:serine/threonine protein kinase/tetratricopeptide (TPR) repeat protein|nr:MAG: hypothetical protein CVU56_06480 [Deltaproteobacteria bacterium HGW-Deltaproteobacteria-14]
MRPLIVKALPHAVSAPRSVEKLAPALSKPVQTTVALDDGENDADNRRAEGRPGPPQVRDARRGPITPQNRSAGEEIPLEQTSQVTPEFLCPECERIFGSGYERCPFDGARLVNLGAGLAAGTVIDNRYTIKRLLGKGGMGSVYVARQHSMDRDVAMKIMHHRADGNHASVQRFFWEVRAARRLQSPHTITVFDFGQTERGSLYLAMELLKGTTLGHLLGVEQRVSPQLTLRISMQICRSLEEAHGKGIIHRDLKPENIFLVQRNSANDFVKVLDFGVAKFLDPDGQSPLTQTGTVFGTPRYMSPEQANSESVDARSDLYSLGIMMYEMLTGKVPFNEDNALELLYKQVHAKPVPLCEVAPWLALDPRLGELVDGLLEKRREARPQSATLVREALEGLANELPDDGEGVPPPIPISEAHAAPAVRQHGTADTQQALDARELLRREMQTPSLGMRTGHDGRAHLLAGRPDESSAARQAVEEGLQGPTGRFVFITGEPGLGKRRLTRWLAAAALKEHDAVLAQSREATHSPHDMPEMRAALEHLLGVTLLERTGLRQALEDHPAFSDHVEHDLITALTDFLRPPLKDGASTAADDDVQRLFSAIHRLLVRISKIRPVVLDAGLLNRASPMTLRFLEYLGAAMPFSPSRIVVLSRIDTSSRPRHAVLRGALESCGWQGESNPSSRHIPMHRLDGQEFKDLLQSLGKVYINLVDYLHYLSGGVPRVAAALVRQIESNPERLHVARMWNPIGHRTALAELPRDLVDEAERHFDRALAAAREPRIIKSIVRIAALIGNSFDIGFLEECVGREDDPALLDALEDGLDLLVAEGCLHEIDGAGDRLRFDNGILRELVLNRIRSQRSVKHLHSLVAGAIADLPPDQLAPRALELATHYACSGDYTRALDHHLVHARAARASGTTEAALQAYLAAAEIVEQLLHDPDAERAPIPAEHEIIAELAQIHFELGLYEQAADSFEGLCQRARDAGDEAALGRAERGLAEVQDALAEYGAASSLFESARDRFRALGERLEAAWCELKRAGSLERRGLPTQARAAYSEARQVFARERDDRGLAEAYNALGLLALREGDASEALRQLRRAADLFKKLHASLDLGKALYSLAIAATDRRDLLMALDAANKALEIFDRHDFRVGISQCLGTIARVLVTQRRPAEARPFFERALRIRENLGDRRGVAEAVASLADIALSLEQFDRALELAFRGRDIYTSIGEFLGAANALRTMGQAQSALGRYEDALAFLREAVATYESLSAKDGDLCDILQSLAECQDRMGLRSDARVTLARALELARELSLSHQTGHLEARLRALA